jgi:hypothetical protein
MNLQENIHRIKQVMGLNESKQVGILYHFTNIVPAISICKSDTLIPNNKCLDGDYRYDPDAEDFEDICEKTKSISFTREKDGEIGQATIGRPVRFKIDGDKLSTKYKIRPYSFYDDSKMVMGLEKYANSEFEERIFNRDVVNLLNYIIDIQVDLKVRIPRDDNETLYKQCLDLISACKAPNLYFTYGKQFIPIDQLKEFIYNI